MTIANIKEMLSKVSEELMKESKVIFNLSIKTSTLISRIPIRKLANSKRT